MTALAERLVAHPVWQREGYGWQPGMVAACGGVCQIPLTAEGRMLFASVECGESYMWTADPGAASLPGADAVLPDIHNPSTQGHLLAQIKVMSSALGALLFVSASYGKHKGLCVTLRRDGRPVAGRDFEGDDAEAAAWLWLADLVEEEGDLG